MKLLKKMCRNLRRYKCKLKNGFEEKPTDWFLELDRINSLLTKIDKKYEKEEAQIAGHIISKLQEGEY